MKNDEILQMITQLNEDKNAARRCLKKLKHFEATEEVKQSSREKTLKPDLYSYFIKGATPAQIEKLRLPKPAMESNSQTSRKGSIELTEVIQLVERAQHHTAKGSNLEKLRPHILLLEVMSTRTL